MTRSTEARDLAAAYETGRLSRRQFVAGALKLGLTVTGAAGLLSACHTTHHQAAPKKLSGRVQILIGFDGGNTAPQRAVQQALAQAFIAAHPQVGIDFLRSTSAEAAETQLNALISRGSAPDIVLGIGLGDVSRLVDQHRWLDLRPLFRRDGVPTSAFVSNAMSAAMLSSYYGSTKAIPGIPLGIHDHALAYNVGLVAKAGVPAPPESWSKGSWSYTGAFLQAAQALTVDRKGKQAGQAGFDATQVAQYGVARLAPQAVFFSFADHLYDGSKRRAQFNSSGALGGAQFAGDLVNRYHVQPSAAALAQLGGTGGTDDDGLSAWRAGKIAMIDLCSCELSTPFASQVPFAWKAAALPAGPARRFGFLEVSLGSIVAESGQHDLAWEVLKFLAVDPAHEGQLAYGGFGAIPALSADAGAFTLGTKQGVGLDPAVWLAGLPSAAVDNDSWVPAYSDVHGLFDTALTQVVGGTPATSVMPQLQQQAQAKIDAWFRANKLPK